MEFHQEVLPCEIKLLANLIIESRLDLPSGRPKTATRARGKISFNAIIQLVGNFRRSRRRRGAPPAGRCRTAGAVTVIRRQ
jgi:hypothetical protein